MARAVCQGAKTAKRYAALGAGMEVDAQGYGREPTAMVRGVLSCLFVCLFVPNPPSKPNPHTKSRNHLTPQPHSPNLTLTRNHTNHHPLTSHHHFISTIPFTPSTLLHPHFTLVSFTSTRTITINIYIQSPNSPPLTPSILITNRNTYFAMHSGSFTLPYKQVSHQHYRGTC